MVKLEKLTTAQIDELPTTSGRLVYDSELNICKFRDGSDTISLTNFTSNGLLGVNTSAPDKQVEINSATGDCLRLTYNDSNGSATNYADFSVSSSGDLTINPSGGDTTISGNLATTLTTASQPNITSVGTLTGLSVTGNTELGDLSGSTGILRILRNSNQILFQCGLELSSNSAADLFIGNMYNTSINSSRKIIFKAGGSVGIGTNSPDKQLEINSSTGDCLRLTYNDSDGSATNYVDFNVNSGGALYITPSGGTTNNEGRIVIDHTNTEALLVRKDGDSGNIFVVDTTNSRVGVNTAPSYDLDISGDINFTDNLYKNGLELNFNSITDIDLTTGFYSSSNYYPIAIRKTIIGDYGSVPVINFQIVGGQLAASNSYNDNTLYGYVRGGGWSDHRFICDVNLMKYTDSEHRFYGIYNGTTSFYGIVIYVRGGYTYSISTDADTVSVGTDSSALTRSGSTFAIKDAANGNDIIGTTTNANFKLNLERESSKCLLHNMFISGKVGINTSALDKQLEINSSTGDCLRLTYNDSDGSATNYADFSVSSSGDLTINPSSGDTTISGNCVIGDTSIGSYTDYFGISDNIFLVSDAISSLRKTAWGINDESNTQAYIEMVHLNNVDNYAYISFNISENYTTDASEKMRLNDVGRLGIGTVAPDKQLEINSSTGDCLRLTYNDSDGSALNYTDFSVSSSGDLTIDAIGGYIFSQSRIVIDRTISNAFVVRKNDNGGDVFIVNTTNSTVGINTSAPDKQLEINSSTGDCLRLTYNDSDGSATNYADFSVSSSGDLTINPSGGDTTISGNLATTLTTASQPNITSVGTLTGLSVTGTAELGDLSGSTGILRILRVSNQILFQCGLELSSDSAADLFIGNMYNTSINSSRKIIFKAGGSVGIGTNSPDKQLEINSSTGDCLRLTYNDSDGSATNYADFSVSSSGDLTIKSTTNKVGIFGNNTGDNNSLSPSLQILQEDGYNGPGEPYLGEFTALRVGTNKNNKNDNSITSYVFDYDYNQDRFTHGKLHIRGLYSVTASSGLSFATSETTGWDTINCLTLFGNKVGINSTAPNKQLEINSSTGDCLRLTYNDSDGSATNYVDLTLNSGGGFEIIPSGGITYSYGVMRIVKTHLNALLVENGSGVDLLLADTINNRVIIGTDTSVANVTLEKLTVHEGNIKIGERNAYADDRYMYCEWADGGNNHQIGLEFDYYTGSGGTSTTHSRLNVVSNAGLNESISGASKQTTASFLSNGKVGIGTNDPDEMLHLKSTGPVYLKLEADTDNTTESDNVGILLSQDGGSVTSYFRILGDSFNTTEIGCSDAISSLAFSTVNTERMRILFNGNIGINSTLAQSLLTIKQTSQSNTGGIRLIKSDSTNYWAQYYDASGHLRFNKDGTDLGYISSSGSNVQMNFTGQHRSITNNSNINTNIFDYVGLIVSSTGVYNNLNSGDINVNEALPVVDLSHSNKDKKVFGVISDKEDTNNTREYNVGVFVSIYDKNEGDDRLIINSVGEGMIWVCSKSGNLENGDYITTSDAVGYGQLQDNEFLCNYTVAKITQDCDFSTPERYIDLSGNIIDETTYNSNPSNGYKCNFVGCTYHCG